MASPFWKTSQTYLDKCFFSFFLEKHQLGTGSFKVGRGRTHVLHLSYFKLNSPFVLVVYVNKLHRITASAPQYTGGCEVTAT